MKNLKKAIGYAFPSSQRAKELGEPGYFVEQYFTREDGSQCPPYIAQGCHVVFDSYDDQDLWALLGEADGELCPMFKKANERGWPL